MTGRQGRRIKHKVNYLKEKEVTENRKRTHKFAFCVKLALEEAVGLS